MKVARQGAKKGNCVRCGVNLKPCYGYRVDGALLCEICAERLVGKSVVREEP